MNAEVEKMGQYLKTGDRTYVAYYIQGSPAKFAVALRPHGEAILHAIFPYLVSMNSSEQALQD